MPLYILHGEKDSTIWGKGMPFPVHIMHGGVKTIAADGDELKIILRNFKNIPYHGGNIVRWPEEWARFLIYNLPLLEEVWEVSKLPYKETENTFIDHPWVIHSNYMDAVFSEGVNSSKAKAIRQNYAELEMTEFFDAVDAMKGRV